MTIKSNNIDGCASLLPVDKEIEDTGQVTSCMYLFSFKRNLQQSVSYVYYYFREEHFRH